MTAAVASPPPVRPLPMVVAEKIGRAREERQRDARYPLSRWYLRPLAGAISGWLAPTAVRPWHLTLANLAVSGLAAIVLIFWPKLAPLAAGLVMFGWLCDRIDGCLARRQGTASAWGAWLDGNIDEVVDLGLHAAVASAASAATGSQLPWGLLIAFFAGKYLLIYGLNPPQGYRESSTTQVRFSFPRPAWERKRRTLRVPGSGSLTLPNTRDPKRESTVGTQSVRTLRSHAERGNEGTQVFEIARGHWLRRLYQLPGNADVRVHLLIAALCFAGLWSGCLVLELLLVAVYYNLRWLVRYGLMFGRLT